MDERLFEEFYPRIYNYIYYRVRHKENAEDLTSDTFFKAVANKARYDAKKSSYSTWIFTIARNNVTDFFRRNKNEQALDDSIEAADGELDEGLVALDDIKNLMAVLAQLNDREREILALRYWGGFSYKEIAGQLGLSVNNVGSIINRSVVKLRKLWHNI